MVSILVACVSVKPPIKPPIEKDNYSYARQHLSWMIEKEIKKHKISGLSIALVVKENTAKEKLAGRQVVQKKDIESRPAQPHIVWQHNIGYADLSTQQKISDATLFRAGSIAKLVNALAIMQLAENGKLKLNHNIKKYLPDFNPKTRFPSDKPITIESLLTHQSGLPSDLIKGMWSSKVSNFNEAINYLQNSYVAQEPDTVFAYSNLGYDVIGAIIEEVTGATYEEYMNSFLQSLGMQNSRFSASPHEPKTAKGYNKGKLKNELSTRDVPAAGLTSNVADLAKLIMLFNDNGKIEDKLLLQEASIQRMLDDYSSDNILNFGKRIGLGLFFYDGIFYRGSPIVGHSGATVNHRAVVKFSPQHKYGVVLLSNSRNSSPSLHRIANKALALLHEAYIGKAAPTQHSYWPQVKASDKTSEKDIVGYYATSAGLAKIYRHNNKLYATIAGRKLNIRQRYDGGFYYLNYKLLGLFPINIGSLGNIGLAIRKVRNKEILIGVNTLGNTTLLGEKISPTPIHPAWRQRIGKYRVVNPLEVIDLPSGGIKIRDGFIIAFATTQDGDKLEVVLQSQNNHEAIVAGIGRGLGETVFVVNNKGKEQLKYANIIFEKQE